MTLLHTKEGVADQFLKDVRECLEALLNSPDAEAGGMVRTATIGYGCQKPMEHTTLDKNIQRPLTQKGSLT